MADTAGVIYDTQEKERIQKWVDMQTEAFKSKESDTLLKNWLVICGISVVCIVGMSIAIRKSRK